jgi:nitrite reductase (cytochrome c-552)
MTSSAEKPAQGRRLALWIAGVIFLLVCIVVVLLGLLAVSIIERRWEAQRPALVLQPIADWEPNSAVWGSSYPREYETYLMTRTQNTRTRYGGAVQRDYLDEDPRLVILFAGYGFSKDYRQARGHTYALSDVLASGRVKVPYNPGTCMTCKSTDVPRLMDRMGAEAFYATNFHDLKKEVSFPIGCQDCHDPRTLRLRITRPALIEGLAGLGRDVRQVAHQDMRSLVCAQCHVEYYLRAQPKDYLTFPWSKGLSVEDIIAYYDQERFTDWVHPLSKTPMIKAQHPDYELFTTGIHAYVGLSCADCHMPYKSEGGVKFTDHHVQSPLLNIANSCAVCHRWSEDQIRNRVEAIQDKVKTAEVQAEEALVKAHLDIAAAMQAGVTDQDLDGVRTQVRHAQFYWDFVSAGNGMGFHSPQEAMRILGKAAFLAEEARISVARLLAAKGMTRGPEYPDLTTRAKALEVVEGLAHPGTAPRPAPQ